MIVKQHSFEIKVALIGNTSSGKTTVLNALFKDCDFAMKRTSAGVNYFRVSGGKGAGETSKNEAREGSELVNNPRTPGLTLNQIKIGSVFLRESGEEVQEIHYNIELNKDLVEMRSDTKLVVVDVPGVSEAGTSRKYRDYVNAKWNTFDCVVVVMDAQKGVNTGEQVEILKNVKNNLQSKKNLPVIILCNKIDDPEDVDQAELVRGARVKVQDVFGYCFGIKAPVFIPISALKAYVYEFIHLRSPDQFRMLEKDKIEKIGKELIGRSVWNRMSYDERVMTTYELINDDPEQYMEGLKASNFDTFLTVLSLSVGGVETQYKLIHKQIALALDSISLDTPCLATDGLKVLHRKQLQLLGLLGVAGLPIDKFTNGLLEKFKKVYQDCEDSAFENFDTPRKVEILARPMLQLIAYHDWVSENSWSDEKHFAASRMEQLVRRQMSVLLEHSSESGSNPLLFSENESPAWNRLSVFDWSAILGSISLLAYDKYFCQLFGEEKILLDRLVHDSNEATRAASTHNGKLCPGCNIVSDSSRCDGCRLCLTFTEPKVGQHCRKCGNRYLYTLFADGDGKLKCKSCKYTHVKCIPVGEILKAATKRKFVDGKLVPVDPENYKKLVHYEIPKSLSNPKHFGHVAWLLCEHLAKQ